MTTGLAVPILTIHWIESGSFKGAELNYTVTEKEFMAIVTFRHITSGVVYYSHRSPKPYLLDGA